MSSTLTFGSKAIYGEGIPIEDLPDFVQAEILEARQDQEELPSASSSSLQEESSASAFASSGSQSQQDPEELSSEASSGTEEVVEDLEEIAMSSTSSNSIITPPNNKYVLLRWKYVTARDCSPPGYDTYSWPSEWGSWAPMPECDVSSAKPQDEYYNCAEILILGPTGSSQDDEPQVVMESQVMVENLVDNTDEILANNDHAETTGSIPVAIDVIQNDVGKSLIVAGTRDGRHGSCTVTEDNQVLYTPQEGRWDGKDRCAYMVCLESSEVISGEVCDEGLIYIHVHPGTEDSITAVDDGIVTGIDQPVRINVAANDEYTSDTLNPVVTETTNASHGTCTAYYNQVLYTPNVGYEGWDHCYYKICLGYSVCDEARVSVKIIGLLENIIEPIPEELEPESPVETSTSPEETPIADTTKLTEMTVFTTSIDPSANPDTATVREGQTVDIDVLANDEDPAGEGLTIVSWTSPKSGTVDSKVNGILRYVPNDGFTGDDCKYECNIEDVLLFNSGVV